MPFSSDIYHLYERGNIYSLDNLNYVWSHRTLLQDASGNLGTNLSFPRENSNYLRDSFIYP